MAKKLNLIRTYQWGAPSLITRLDVREQDSEHSVAYIFADLMHEDLGHLHRLRELFKSKGWVSSSDTREGQSVLRLTGIKDENQLISVLQSGGYAKGELHASQEAHPKKQSVWDKIKSNSLKASGVVYMIGNAIYVISGFARKKNLAQIGTGVSFATGDILLATVGGKDDARQFKSLLKKFKSHLEENGIAIPKDTALETETRNRNTGLGGKIYDFLHEHVNKFKALAEVAGGVNYFFAGKKDKLPWKQATAVIFTLGFGSTLFIKEKKPDKEKLKDAGTWEKIKAWAHEKPLRIGGISGYSNTLFTTISAFQERAAERLKPLEQRSLNYRYDWAAAGTMLFGNGLYAMSNKTTGGSITEEGLVRDIYGIAAQVLNHVPDDKREAAIKAAVDFLGERVEIRGSREEINALLRAQMVLSQDNPWFRANTNAPPPPAEKIAAAREVKFTASLPSKDGSWKHLLDQSVVDQVAAPAK